MGQEVTTNHSLSAIFRTASHPFDPPDTGKIVIKVINHYGDEVLEVLVIRDTTIPEWR
jgi:hypothetical protein